MGPYSKRPVQIAPLLPLGHNFNTSETMWATTRAPSTTPDQTNNLMIDSHFTRRGRHVGLENSIGDSRPTRLERSRC